MGSVVETLTETEFLFARPRVWYGASRLLDLAALLDTYNISPTPEIADELALYCDWYMVGEDFRSAIGKFLQEQSRPAPSPN